MLTHPTHMRARTEYSYPRGHLLHYLALGLRNFAGFQVSKTSVNKRLLLCHLQRDNRPCMIDSGIETRGRETFAGAKVHKKNDIRKFYVIFLCFYFLFWLITLYLALA